VTPRRPGRPGSCSSRVLLATVRPAQAQLRTLAKTTPAAADTSLLDRLPLAGDILPRLTPRLKARLFQVFDITVLWNKPARQATVTAEISEALLQALTTILDPGQDGFQDTAADQPGPVGHLTNTLDAVESHIHAVAHGAQDPRAVRGGGSADPAAHSSPKRLPRYRGTARRSLAS
jgi:hypothetical protein